MIKQNSISLCSFYFWETYCSCESSCFYWVCMFNDIKKGIKLARKYNLKTVVSSKDINEAEKISRLKPDYVAIEPPELISGRISVSEAKPELIKNAAKKIKNLLVGAGIHNKLDVKKSIEYGAIGILFF